MYRACSAPRLPPGVNRGGGKDYRRGDEGESDSSGGEVRKVINMYVLISYFLIVIKIKCYIL